jgi:FeoC like transcriptional regulator
MSAGPLRLVLAAVDDGALTIGEIQGRTGLSTDMIRHSLEHLQRMGRLSAEPLTVGCPPAGCGGCSSAGVDTGTCATGPVLVGLSPVRHAS